VRQALRQFFRGFLNASRKRPNAELREQDWQVTHRLTLNCANIFCEMSDIRVPFFQCQTSLHTHERPEYHHGIRMNRLSASRNAWHPQTKEDRDAVLRELKNVLASQHFSSSKRYPALLQFVVENTLEGKSDLLKERTLGVDVFDRQPAYDTNTDTVVRYTAGEVRKRLSLYYHEQGRTSQIRISLPAGSYVPEFLYGPEASEDTGDDPASLPIPVINGRLSMAPAGEMRESELFAPSTLVDQTFPPGAAANMSLGSVPRRNRPTYKRLFWPACAALVVLLAITGLSWRYRIVHPRTALDDFWGPVLHDQRTVLICTGSVIFAPERASGTLTAGKDIEYPFVSMEGASAISHVSGLLQSSGVQAQLKSAGATPLTELREHSFILMGAFNNQWTLRLVQPLQFHFASEPAESIVDRMQPQVRWLRDPSLPYSSADDYALVARYRDSTTDSWVVVLAGVGRNGTEAAAEFASSPHYMQLLRDQLGKDFSTRNIEAVLKVSVIDGKTGAPSILAVHAW
jgi:hypothetical protein